MCIINTCFCLSIQKSATSALSENSSQTHYVSIFLIEIAGIYPRSRKNWFSNFSSLSNAKLFRSNFAKFHSMKVQHSRSEGSYFIHLLSTKLRLEKTLSERHKLPQKRFFYCVILIYFEYLFIARHNFIQTKF